MFESAADNSSILSIDLGLLIGLLVLQRLLDPLLTRDRILFGLTTGSLLIMYALWRWHDTLPTFAFSVENFCRRPIDDQWRLPALLHGASHCFCDRVGRSRGTRTGRPPSERRRTDRRHVAWRPMGGSPVGGARRAAAGAEERSPGTGGLRRGGDTVRRLGQASRSGPLPFTNGPQWLTGQHGPVQRRCPELAPNGHGAVVAGCLLSEQQRTTFARSEYFA